MISCKLKSGDSVGVSFNSHNDCVLLQTSKDNEQIQNRISLTKEETQSLIEILRHNINILENK